MCYDKEGFVHLENELEEKTMRRVDMTSNNGHHSVYDHILINFNLQNLPKILAMVLNNEHQYATSEKSARYTPVVRQVGSIIAEDEERLLKNEKYRNLSIFGKDLDKKEEHFGDVYSTIYKGSFAEFAQAHRHRTLDYQMEM